MEEEGNHDACTCLHINTQEFEKGRCRWKRRIGIWAGLFVHRHGLIQQVNRQGRFVRETEATIGKAPRFFGFWFVMPPHI